MITHASAILNCIEVNIMEVTLNISVTCFLHAAITRRAAVISPIKLVKTCSMLGLSIKYTIEMTPGDGYKLVN